MYRLATPTLGWAPSDGAVVNDFDILSNDSLLRLPDILGDSTATPPIRPLIPISRSAWWAGVKSGRYPRPLKLSANTTVWRARDIKAFLDSLEQQP
jgi:prophage regulatory protein